MKRFPDNTIYLVNADGSFTWYKAPLRATRIAIGFISGLMVIFLSFYAYSLYDNRFGIAYMFVTALCVFTSTLLTPYLKVAIVRYHTCKDLKCLPKSYTLVNLSDLRVK